MSTLRHIASRLRHLDCFQQRLVERLIDLVIEVLAANTPGEHLPGEWTFSITTTGDGVAGKIWNERPERDPDFDLIMIYLDLGTVMHWVEPVNAEYLHWVDDGIHYFSKGHMVSGIQASHFGAKADREIREFEKRIPAMLAAYLERGTLP